MLYYKRENLITRNYMLCYNALSVIEFELKYASEN